jgi:hypothetical protein
MNKLDYLAQRKLTLKAKRFMALSLRLDCPFSFDDGPKFCILS